MDKLIEKFLAPILLRAAESGTQTDLWKRISGSKAAGFLLMIFGLLGYMLGQLTAEQAGALVAAGFGMTRLRVGQEKETAKVKEHLNTQDEKLDTLLEELKKLRG